MGIDLSSISSYGNSIPQPVTGEIIFLPQNASTPTGYLKCDGNIVSQATYANLYSTIGLIVDNLGHWTAGTSGTSSTIRAITYGNGLYVYAGNGGMLRTSTDAITWDARTSGTTSSIYSLTYGNGLYVYAGIGGVLRTSTDAITWDSRTSGTTSSIQTITYGNGLYLYGATGGVLRTSTDAITWDARTSGTSSTIRSITYGNGIYLYAASNGSIGTSTDAITWTNTTSIAPASIQTILAIDGIYSLMTATKLATSTNLTTWKFTKTLADGKLGYFKDMYITANTKEMYASFDMTMWKDFSLDGVSLVSATETLSTIYGDMVDKLLIATTTGKIYKLNNPYTYDVGVDFALPRIFTDNGTTAFIRY